MATKKFTILHSNDMHGDFFADNKKERGELIGGLSLLSAYINKVRAEEENVIYVIAGDMLQGSIIDSEYKGISTIEIMNYLAPDVVALGNHEFDYGLPHLLFLEKMANFPIVNANLYIKQYNRRLMRPYLIIKKAGFDILFTGIITDKVIDSIKQDKLIGSFVSLEEAGQEVGRICNAYKNEDIDLTILLTHIGYESDQALAKLLNPDWGVDMIIGGHSHTILEKPDQVNNILIAQAGVGTDQIGRFDIEVDDDTNSIVSYKWRLVKIDKRLVKPDHNMTKFLNSFKNEVDAKYSAIVTKLARKHQHLKREVETELGNLFADAFNSAANADVVLVGSGSIRSTSLGPIVTKQDLLTCFPYDDSLSKFTVSGSDMIKIFTHFMRPENRNGEGENYQVNEAVTATYNEKLKQLEALSINGTAINPDALYSLVLQNYHVINSLDYLNISNENLCKLAPAKVVSTSARDVVEEYLHNNQNIYKVTGKRLIYKKS